MMARFSAEEFVTSLKEGELDGRLVEELRKLTDEQLEEVVGLIMEERLRTPQTDESARG